MTYETRLQIGDYFITIDIDGSHRRGFEAAVYFERAADQEKSRMAAIKHRLADRFTTDAKAHQAALQHAMFVIKIGDVEGLESEARFPARVDAGRKVNLAR